MTEGLGGLGWLDVLGRLRESATPCVLVTLAAVRGHAPREAGAKMVVTAGEAHGTVGGGNLEMTAASRARELLRGGAQEPETLTLRLTASAPAEHGRQCCGGEVTLLLEPFCTFRPSVGVFGVGHVGLALARVLSTLELELHLVDSRGDALDPLRLAPLRGSPARLHVHHAPVPELALGELPQGAHVVIMTHDHAEDAALCDAALRHPGLGFIGLIGSAAKWRHFREQLGREGHGPEQLERIVCPIGLPGLRGKRPEVIALSVAAQLLGVMEGAEVRARTAPLGLERAGR